MPDKLLGLSERRWLKLALTLHFQPGNYLHKSWYQSLPQGVLIQQLRELPTSAQHIDHHLRTLLTLKYGPLPYDFTQQRLRLALLDGQALAHLSLYLGLALRSASLRHELLGERLRSLHQALGAEAFIFALKRAPFLGTIPSFPFEPELEDPQTRFPMIGARYCLAQVAELNRGLAQRMMLKLPQAWAAWICPEEETDNTRPQALKKGDHASAKHHKSPDLPPLVRKLIKEQLPEWIPLFA